MCAHPLHPLSRPTPANSYLRGIRYRQLSLHGLARRRLTTRLFFTFLPKRRISVAFHVVVLQRTAKKYTEIYNARAEQLYFSLNFFFSDGAVAVAVAVAFCDTDHPTSQKLEPKGLINDVGKNEGKLKSVG